MHVTYSISFCPFFRKCHNDDSTVAPWKQAVLDQITSGITSVVDQLSKIVPSAKNTPNIVNKTATPATTISNPTTTVTNTKETLEHAKRKLDFEEEKENQQQKKGKQFVQQCLASKVSFFYQCSKMQFITFQNVHIRTCFSQFIWFFSLKC